MPEHANEYIRNQRDILHEHENEVRQEKLPATISSRGAFSFTANIGEYNSRDAVTQEETEMDTFVSPFKKNEL